MLLAREQLLLFAAEDRRGETNQVIARYCLLHFDELDGLTITQLARDCHVSAATVTRFCRTMGYDDFLHFKDACRFNRRISNVAGGITRTAFGNDTADFTGPGLQEAGHAIGAAIQRCLAGVEAARMERLVRTILEREDVLLIGMDYSALVTLYIQNELAKWGKIVRVLRDSSLHEVACGPGTLLVLFSMNGYSLSAMVEQFSRLRAQGADLWVLTQLDPARCPCATGVLQVGRMENQTYHRYAELALADMLLAYCREELDRREK